MTSFLSAFLFVEYPLSCIFKLGFQRNKNENYMTRSLGNLWNAIPRFSFSVLLQVITRQSFLPIVKSYY